MSEVRLVIREAGQDWSGTMHGSCSDRAIAALSADPVTLAELEAACARFARPTPRHLFFASLSPGLRAEPHDAGIVVIDLVARLVVVESTYSSPQPVGEVCYHDGEGGTDTWLRYHLADDWLFTGDHNQWQAIAEERRRERSARPLRDARQVFYGRPLLEFVARETFAAFAQRMTQGASPTEEGSPRRQTEDDITHDMLKQIHAAWLLTPREDLGGVCPREVALEQRDHLSWDLQDQCERWSLLGECPPGLDQSSFAFRYGGFGTHELVKYYDLVRELLWSCWGRLVTPRPRYSGGEGSGVRGTDLPWFCPLTPNPSPPSTGARGDLGNRLTIADFLTSEVPRLESVRDQWLETPDAECHGRTPRSIIDRERARLPEGMSGHDAMVDADCPCCQMLADMPGPAFWGLDGSSMDDDFAFDLTHRTREEWEAEQREWEEHFKRCEAERAERKRLGKNSAGEESVWSSSFVVADTPDTPLSIRLFGIGCRLGELIEDLRRQADDPSVAPQVQPWIDQLNRDFGNLSELLQVSEPAVAASLISPVLDRFADSLAAVALACPNLAAKCESLTSSLGEFRDLEETTGDAGDSDSPF